MTFFMSFALIMTIACQAAEARKDIQTRTFDVDDKLKSVRVDNSVGTVTIVPSDEKKIKVVAERIGFGEGCDLRISKSKREVEVTNTSRGAFNTNECRANLEITAPEGTALNIRTGSGDVTFQDQDKAHYGGVKLSTGSGDIELNGRFNFIDARTGSGDLKVRTDCTDVKLKSGSGDVEIGTYIQPDKMNLEVEAGTGDVTVRLPEGTKVWTRLRSGTGDTVNELTEAADAMVRIEAHSGTGDIRVRKL